MAGFVRRYGRQPLGGEIGCTLSHAQLLAAFGDGNGADDDLLVVAEDDAVLGDDFEPVLRNLVRSRSWDCINLANPFDPAGRSPFLSVTRDWASLSWLAKPVGPGARRFAYRAGAYHGMIAGAGLYMVTRQGARLMAAFAAEQGPSWVADDYDAWHIPAGLEVHMLRPNLAGWSGGSEIKPSGRAHRQAASPALSAWGRVKTLLGRKSWPKRVVRARNAARATWKDLRQAKR